MDPMVGNGEKEQLFGRGEDDHERLFPKYTTAQAASTGEVIVNGKTLKIWEFTQLETLKPAVMRQRAMAIRDAVGEANCPPMPTMQTHDMIRWILHMQSVLVEPNVKGCRNAMQGSGPSPSFLQECEGRPILKERAPSPTTKPLPFGIRKMQGGMEALRDHYGELLERKNETEEAQPRGIATMRVGGEGRRHIFPQDHMENDGVSKADPLGIESMREQGEGRRFLRCPDHLFMQQKEREAMDRGVPPENFRPRQGPESRRAGGYAMSRILTAEAPPSDPGNQQTITEMPIGGDRKKHLLPEDHMLNSGTADAVEATIGHGRKHIDNFAGRTQMSGAQGVYKASWKQDPSRLMGTSLVV